MAHVSADRVKETSASTGTGAFSLAGAVAGFRAFSAVCANGDTCWYCIAGQSGSEWEIGLGTWGTGGILTRTAVLTSSNAGASVNFSAGTKDVFITVPAGKLPIVVNDGDLEISGGIHHAQDAQTPLNITRFFVNGVMNYDGYGQHQIQNKSAGTASSTDFVVTADTGTDSARYGDFGINGSNYSGTWGAALDVYLYSDGGAPGVGDLVIGTQQTGTYLDIHIGGGAATNRVVRFSSTGTLWTAFSSDPSTPAADTIHFYMKKIGGRILPKIMGPSGVDTPLQPFLGMNHIRMIGTGTGTTTALVCSWFGIQIVCVAAGTMAQTTPATGSLKSRTRLSSLTSAATAGALCSIRGAQLEAGRETGFFFAQRFALDTLLASCFGFWGLYASATAPGVTVNHVTSTAVAKIGLALNTNTGNWKLVTCSGSAVTALDLGESFPINTTDLMELVLFCAPGASTINYRVTNLTTGATASGDLTATLPGATTYMTPLSTLSNNATASAVKFSHKIIYLETDY